MVFAIQFINVLFNIMSLGIVARIIMSWFRSNPSGQFYQFIVDTTQPILNLAKRITPRAGMLDFSPLIALIGLDLLRYLIISLLIKL